MTEPEYADDAPLAEKLRAWIPESARHGRTELEHVLEEAAERIVELEREVDRLRKKLENSQAHEWWP